MALLRVRSSYIPIIHNDEPSRLAGVSDMARFLFINTTISWNKGSAAQVASTRDAVREHDSDARFSLLSYCTTQDRAFEDHYGVSVVGYDDDRGASLRRGLGAYGLRIVVALMMSVAIRIALAVGVPPGVLARERFCRAILASDAVIDLSGDSLSDRGSHSAVNLAGIILCILLKKPVICYSQSIGPFSRWTQPVARFALSRVEGITVRERMSCDYLLGLGLRPERIGLFGDCAFNLSAANDDRVDEILSRSGVREAGGDVIGISASALMTEIQAGPEGGPRPSIASYADVIRTLADEVRRADPRATILLVPHVIAPATWAKDDRWACNRLIEGLRDREHVVVLSADYTAEELKGVIGRCSFFIGSRMHACIAALSQHVPTVALSWSHKYPGIMERLGMRRYVFDTTKQTPEEIREGIMAAYLERKAISGELSVSAEAEKRSAAEGASAIVRAVQ